MKSGDIVVYKDTIGTAVTAVGEKDVLRFLPCNHRICSFSSLDIITEEVAREATHDEKIKLITEEYVWGEVVKVHQKNSRIPRLNQHLSRGGMLFVFLDIRCILCHTFPIEYMARR